MDKDYIHVDNIKKVKAEDDYTCSWCGRLFVDDERKYNMFGRDDNFNWQEEFVCKDCVPKVLNHYRNEV